MNKKLDKAKVLELLKDELSNFKEEEFVQGKRLLPLGEEFLKMRGVRPFGYTRDSDEDYKYDKIVVYCPDMENPEMARKFAQWLENNNGCDLYYAVSREDGVKQARVRERERILGLPEKAMKILTAARDWWNVSDEFETIIPDEHTSVTFYIFGSVLDIYRNIDDGIGKFVKLVEKSINK